MLLNQALPAVSVVLKLSLVQLHSQVWRLEVQGNHLATGIPEDLKAQ